VFAGNKNIFGSQTYVLKTRLLFVAFTALEAGNVSVIFASPEVLESKTWFQVIKRYRHRVCLVTFDEVHCMSEWWVLLYFFSVE